MKTPYDAALRLRQREMDEMRRSITVEVNHIAVLDQHCADIDASVRAETDFASGMEHFSAHAFTMRMRAQRQALRHEREAGDGRLSALRARAMETYGSLSAISAAADRHRAAATQAAAIAEQGQVDDFSAARFNRAAQAARRAREMRGPDA